MPKKPLSVTLDEGNLLWLKGRAAGRKKRSLSDALDEIIREARNGGRGAEAPRSVVGTVDIAIDDPDLEHADVVIRSLVGESLARPVFEPAGKASGRHVPMRAPGRPQTPRKARRG